MDWHTIQFILLAFGVGTMFGTLLSYFFMRRIINKNMKSLSRHITQLNAHNNHTARKINARRENLLLLADKLRQIENNLEKLRQKDFNMYLNSLNFLLDQKGITRIDDKN